MRFVLLSDVHATSKNPIARQDDILSVFYQKFIYVLQYAAEHNYPILQAGDFFNRPRDWYLLHGLLALLKDCSVDLYSIFGQHDMYLYADKDNTPTSLGILAQSGQISILGPKPKKFKGQVYVYGASWNEPIPTPKGKINILVIHAPISDISLFPGHEYTKAHRFAEEQEGYDLILCGDIHREFVHHVIRTMKGSRDTWIVNTGPMLRLEAVEYNLGHGPCFYTYDTKTKKLDKVGIPHPRARDVLSRVHIKAKQHINEILDEFITSLQDMPDVSADIFTNIKNYVDKEAVDEDVKQIISEVMTIE